MSVRQPAPGVAKTGPFRPFAIVAALVMASLSPGCAHDPPAPPTTDTTPAAGKPLPPLPRSSIAAVVQHRGELGLTDEQVEAMEKRDREREDEDRALHAEDERRKKAIDGAARNATGTQNAVPSARGPGGGMRGGGMRGGGMGGPRGGPGPGGVASKPQGDSLEDRLDANDTRAYLDVEDVLTPAQRDPAREIASDFRAQLYDRRQQQNRH